MRDEAMAMAMAMAYGAVEVPFVVRWADARIAQQEHPAEALLELSMASRRPPLDLVGLLQRVPGELVAASAQDLFVQLLWRAVQADPSRLRAMLNLLYSQAGNTLPLDDELEGRVRSAGARLCLSADGIVAASFEDECDALRAELHDFAERARSRGVEWPSDDGAATDDLGRQAPTAKNAT